MNCCDDYGKCRQCHGCPVRATPFPPPTPKGSPMTATHWLIVAIVITLLCLLAGLWLASRVKQAANTTPCRTANAEQMARDVRALQKQLSIAPRPRHRAGQPAMHSFPVNLEQVRASAVRAALRDMGKGTSTLNPYRGKGAAATTWTENYARVMCNQRDVHQAALAAAPAMQTTARQETSAS